MKHKLLYLTIAFFMGAASAYSQNAWPKELTDADGGKITMYEPQPESLSGNEMTGRAAISYKETSTSEPVFGAVLFTAVVKNGSGSLLLESFRINRDIFSAIDYDHMVYNFSALL
jgi:hypothetical protein